MRRSAREIFDLRKLIEVSFRESRKTVQQGDVKEDHSLRKESVPSGEGVSGGKTARGLQGLVFIFPNKARRKGQRKTPIT